MNEVYETLGESFSSIVSFDYEKELRCIGSSIQEFFNNLDGFHSHILSTQVSKDLLLPAMSCSEKEKGKFTIRVYFLKTEMRHFTTGLIRGLAKYVLRKDTRVNMQNINSIHENKIIYDVSEIARKCSLCEELHCDTHENSRSTLPSDLGMKVMTFCSSFPFHFILDKKLQIVQLGASLMRIVSAHIQSKGSHFGTYFELIKPIIHMTFSSFLSRINTTFELVSKVGFTSYRENMSHVSKQGRSCVFCSRTCSTALINILHYTKDNPYLIKLFLHIDGCRWHVYW
jgi:guanylate cyclase soluble subunit alpha